MAEKPRIRATAGSGRGGPLEKRKEPGKPEPKQTRGSAIGEANKSRTVQQASKTVRSGSPAETMRTVGSGKLGVNNPRIDTTPKLSGSVGTAAKTAGRFSRFIPGVGAAAGLVGGMAMLGDTLKDLREKEEAKAKARRDTADADQRKAASFPRGNPSGRSKTASTEGAASSASTPSKNTQKPSSGQKKAPGGDKPMTDAEILAWNNKRKAARGEKQLDKSVMDKASYKRGK